VGKKARGPEPQAPDQTPGDKDEVNFNDPESRIKKTKDGFQQSYTAQAGVETSSLLIVAPPSDSLPTTKRNSLRIWPRYSATSSPP